ncbi:UDP-glucuronosyltransferase 1-10 [Orussus abietinus]|uniref:UDP-glucuronosyltransferase 1-10 n=1 Tax=Orussus abietinus TaxID=222816 RepID=UPI0006253914|nr:UDP-glucuronosyltransferase 1-10 [Orussus abietinus]
MDCTKLILFVVLWCANLSASFRILGICPSSSFSHQQPFQALMKALVMKGHEVTVISTIPMKLPAKNYRNVDVSFTYRKKDCTGLRHVNAFKILMDNMNEANNLCEEQLTSDAVQQLMSRNETFDAVIIEQLWFQCYYALVKHYNYPILIGYLSVGNLPYVMDSVGNPDDPTLNPDMAYPFTDRMTLEERIWNIIYTTWCRLYYRYVHLPRVQRILDKWFPGTSVYDVDRNFSLVILGNNHVLGYPKPLLPNVVEVHSLQIQENPDPLPIEIQDFLDSGKDGVVYFSLGSNLQGHQLPPLTLKALFDAFSALKYRILWKYNNDASFNITNIKFVKWAPQQAILAHPNVKAYIMQGGLQSLQEAVHYMVPVIAIPFFGDQNFNARKILDTQIGLNLNVDSMTKETIMHAVSEVIDNPKYSKNIKQLGDILKDEPVKPLNRALWHVEHVLKFPNARHLRYHGRDISWLEHHTVEVLFCFAIILLISALYKCSVMRERNVIRHKCKMQNRFEEIASHSKSKDN